MNPNENIENTEAEQLPQEHAQSQSEKIDAVAGTLKTQTSEPFMTDESSEIITKAKEKYNFKETGDINAVLISLANTILSLQTENKELVKLTENHNRNVNDLSRLVSVQRLDGNYNFSAYMLGLTNGLLLALSIMVGTDYQPIDRPKEWIGVKMVD